MTDRMSRKRHHTSSLVLNAKHRWCREFINHVMQDDKAMEILEGKGSRWTGGQGRKAPERGALELGPGVKRVGTDLRQIVSV
jgi:hypothetical protein